jgi:betaine-aldehyde dehydrogenase
MEAEVLGMANDTVSLASSSDERRSGHARRTALDSAPSGQRSIPIASEMPHGGFKQSGMGKDMSAHSLEHYTELKHVMVNLS